MANELGRAVEKLVLESFQIAGSRDPARVGEIRAVGLQQLAFGIARMQRHRQVGSSSLSTVAAAIDITDERLLAQAVYLVLRRMRRQLNFCGKTNTWYLKGTGKNPGHGSAKSRGTVRRARRGNARVGVPRLA